MSGIQLNRELRALSDNVNASIVRCLGGRTRRASCTVKIQISVQLFDFLKSQYGMRFTLEPHAEMMDDMRIVRAQFVNERDYARGVQFKFAIRNSRAVVYRSFKEGELVTRELQPSPYFVINFFRDEKVLDRD